MKNPICTVEDIYNTPYWNTIHQENCLLQYQFDNAGEHSIYHPWNEISNLIIKKIDSLFECVFKLDLAPFGIENHVIPVINFNNDKFNWIFYQLDHENKISHIEGYLDGNGIKIIPDDVEELLHFNHIDYHEESYTKDRKGKTFKIIKNEEAPILKQFTQQEADEFAANHDLKNGLEDLEDIEDPLKYFITFNEEDKVIPQDDVYDLLEIYDDFAGFKDYFGAVPKRNQNGFQVPLVNGRQMPFVGQYNDSIFTGYDIYCYIFYDKETRTVAIFQQMT
ncbi:hypothetical protein QWT87_16390 [Chryseobacterium sp. APV1]|uniref:DUF1963 domain-containing protein n=1 Tax=Chryseobacterium urinae TaxID=3058400 RepID=A0ABT8U5U9_9FLAO|nr:hypothetical protein [Chryseobacterium sp. APV1]MDO3426461.1 hypothetical protein [Chryseobacterium sp. APV1]